MCNKRLLRLLHIRGEKEISLCETIPLRLLLLAQLHAYVEAVVVAQDRIDRTHRSTFAQS